LPGSAPQRPGQRRILRPRKIYRGSDCSGIKRSTERQLEACFPPTIEVSSKHTSLMEPPICAHKWVLASGGRRLRPAVLLVPYRASTLIPPSMAAFDRLREIPLAPCALVVVATPCGTGAGRSRTWAVPTRSRAFKLYRPVAQGQGRIQLYYRFCVEYLRLPRHRTAVAVANNPRRADPCPAHDLAIEARVSSSEVEPIPAVPSYEPLLSKVKVFLRAFLRKQAKRNALRDHQHGCLMTMSATAFSGVIKQPSMKRPRRLERSA